MENEKKERKTVAWEMEENSTLLKATFPNGKDVTFDIARIFPDILTATKAQAFTVQYGVKQFLSDKTARSEGEKLSNDDKVVVMKTRYDDLVEGNFRVNKAGGVEKISKAKVEKNLDAMSDEELAEIGLTRDAAKILMARIMKK